MTENLAPKDEPITATIKISPELAAFFLADAQRIAAVQRELAARLLKQMDDWMAKSG